MHIDSIGLCIEVHEQGIGARPLHERQAPVGRIDRIAPVGERGGNNLCDESAHLREGDLVVVDDQFAYDSGQKLNIHGGNKDTTKGQNILKNFVHLSFCSIFAVPNRGSE